MNYMPIVYKNVYFVWLRLRVADNVWLLMTLVNFFNCHPFGSLLRMLKLPWNTHAYVCFMLRVEVFVLQDEMSAGVIDVRILTVLSRLNVSHSDGNRRA